MIKRLFILAGAGIMLLGPGASSALASFGFFNGANTFVVIGYSDGDKSYHLSGDNTPLLGVFNGYDLDSDSPVDLPFSYTMNGLRLNGFEIHTVETGGDIVDAAYLDFKIYQQGNTPPAAWETIAFDNMSFVANLGSTNRTFTSDASINLVSVLANRTPETGSYFLEVQTRIASGAGEVTGTPAKAGFSAMAVPEPGTLILFGLGAVLIRFYRQRFNIT